MAWIWGKLRRYWWAVLAAVVAVVAALALQSRRRRSELLAPVLQKHHEAEIDARTARWKLRDQEREQIRRTRKRLEDRLEDIDREELRKRELEKRNPAELLAYYREIERQLGPLED